MILNPVRMERVSKKSKTDQLAELCKSNPEKSYRISKSGAVQVLSGKRWKTLCKHNTRKGYCSICGGNEICLHDKRRERCIECKGSGICVHKRVKYRCKKCVGNAICIHNRIKYSCRQCGGSSICDHYKIRTRCLLCKGGHVCKHDKVRSQCGACCGSSMCIHNRQRASCVECKGSQMCLCDKARKVKDGYCTRCHPDYIETVSGCSKIACRFFDQYGAELGQPIQHYHYDLATKQVTGSEHKPSGWPNKGVDGFIGPNIAIEFLGDYYHGHPSLHNGDSANSLFLKTTSGLQKLKSLGYVVVYIWESDFCNRKGLQSIQSICRTFEGTLEYTMY
jgi:hypothetical protein